MNTDPEFRFALGDVVATRGADALMRAHDFAPVRLLARHLMGDWGEVSPADAQANEAALKSGARLLSCYVVGGQKVWVVTTILLPSEY